MPLYAPRGYSVLEKTLVLEVETHEKRFIPGRSGWVVLGVLYSYGRICSRDRTETLLMQIDGRCRVTRTLLIVSSRSSPHGLLESGRW